MPSDELASSASAATLVERGDLEVLGRMPWSSNATYLCEARCGDDVVRAIYKPRRGERPLWDFPSGLDHREVAAYQLSEALGWGLVPFTVLRDGPLGPGSVQLFVEADFEQHYFTLYEDESTHPQLQRLCVFDLLANNTDRKSGHCLLAHERVWAIDNGLCFSASFKLRTVIWEFAGEPIEEALLDRVAALVERVPVDIAALLDDDEIEGVRHRAVKLVTERVFPSDVSGHRYPWPLV